MKIICNYFGDLETFLPKNEFEKLPTFSEKKTFRAFKYVPYNMVVGISNRPKTFFRKISWILFDKTFLGSKL